MAKRREFTEEQIEDICNTYLINQTRRPLALKYGCKDSVILRILKENNIAIRHVNTKPEKSSEYRKFNINDNFFSINNQTHNTAYILGMLASDGCVAGNSNQIYIELQRSDKEILEKINSELENERPVKDYIAKSRKNPENSKMYFYSKQIKEDLALYNIIPNKTVECVNKDFMQNIREEYFIDYIRGHFDGDGSIKWTNGTIAWQIDSSSLPTLQHICSVLKKYGIKTEFSKKNKKSVVNLDMYRLYFYGKQNGLALHRLFYEYPPTVTLRMKRKQEHFTELLLKYKSHEASDLRYLRGED